MRDGRYNTSNDRPLSSFICPIRAVIFDLGGVLVRTVERAAQQKWERRLGLRDGELPARVVETEESMLAARGLLDEEQAWGIVARRFSLNSAQLEEFKRDYYSGDRLDAELVSFLKSLRPEFKTVILSNAWSGARALFESQFSLSKLVDEVIYSSEVGCAKPDPRIFRLSLERLGVGAHELLFLDDKEVNVLAARRAGIPALHFKQTTKAIAELRVRLGR